MRLPRRWTNRWRRHRHALMYWNNFRVGRSRWKKLWRGSVEIARGGTVMSDETRRVLEMLDAGKINLQDAERLLDKLASSKGTGENVSGNGTTATDNRPISK